MGCMRPSKSDEGLNFHLRIKVHAMTEAPMQAARTIRTVTAVCGRAEEYSVVLLCVGVGALLEPVVVRYTTDLDVLTEDG